MVTSLHRGLSARRPTLRGEVFSVLILVLVNLSAQDLLHAVLYSELIVILSFFYQEVDPHRPSSGQGYKLLVVTFQSVPTCQRTQIC